MSDLVLETTPLNFFLEIFFGFLFFSPGGTTIEGVEALEENGFARLPAWQDALERYLKEIL